MNAWETVLAAVGGTLLGLGFGITIGRRGEERVRLERARLEAELRETVLPVLAERASELGVDTTARGTDAFAESIELALSIKRGATRSDLPYSDTLDVSATSLSTTKTRGKQ